MPGEISGKRGKKRKQWFSGTEYTTAVVPILGPQGTVPGYARYNTERSILHNLPYLASAPGVPEWRTIHSTYLQWSLCSRPSLGMRCCRFGRLSDCWRAGLREVLYW
jgi:hypothetical protein